MRNKGKKILLTLILAILNMFILLTVVSNADASITTSKGKDVIGGLVGESIKSTGLVEVTSGGDVYRFYQEHINSKKNFYVYCVKGADTLPEKSANWKTRYTFSSGYIFNEFPKSSLPDEIKENEFKDWSQNTKYTADNYNKIAYILSSYGVNTTGKYSTNPLQRAIWGTELNSTKTGTNSIEKNENQALVKEAKAYSNFIKNYSPPEIQKEPTTYTGNVIGPFSIRYYSLTQDGYTFGDIKSAELVVDAGKGTEKRYNIGTGWTFSDSLGNNTTNTYPSSATTFHIKITDENILKNDKIDLDIKFVEIQVSAYAALFKGNKTIDNGTNCQHNKSFLRCSSHSSKKTNCSGCSNMTSASGKAGSPVKCGTHSSTTTTQVMAIVGGIRNDVTTTVKFPLETKENEFDIKITKVDTDTGTKIAGAKFKISGSGVADASKEYTTSSIGELTFDIIKMPADGTYEYTITETFVPAQYDLPAERNTKVKVTIQGKKVTKAEISQNGSIATVQSTADLSVALQVKNKQASKEFDMKITKIDTDTGAKIAGVKFKISGSGVVNQAKEYTTSSTGELTFDKIKMPIDGTYEYTITEISVPAQYDLPSEVNTKVKVTIQGRKVTSATITQNGAATVLNRADLSIALQIKNKQASKQFDIKVTKVDESNTGIKISGAKFKISGPGVANASKEYTTSTTGELTFDKIQMPIDGTYTYTVTEISVPKPYKLPSQLNTNISVTIQGRKVTSATITQNGAATVINRADLAIGLQIKNNKTVTITGTVWNDIVPAKGIVADGKMDAGEQRLANVEVFLVNLSTNRRVKNTKTDTSGNYSFTDVEAGVNYRVEFEYDGLKYAATTKDTSIGTITFNNGVCNTNNTNTSKADETEAVREVFNNKFNTISKNKATATNGSVLTLSYTQAKAGVGNYLVSTLNKTSGGIATYKIQADTDTIKLDNVNLPVNKEYTINNVNLGLVERYQASFALMNDMVRSEVFYQGEMIEAQSYGKKDQKKTQEILIDSDKLAALKNEAYTVEIDAEWLKQGTEVYLVYMVVVQNNADKAVGTLNEIVQYFDKEFTLASAWYGGSATGGGTNLAVTSNTAGSNYNSTRIKDLNRLDASVVNGKYIKSMISGEAMTFYLKYKISDIETIFKDVPINGTIEKVATSEISSYSFNSQDNLNEEVNKGFTRLQKAKLIKGQVDYNSQPENETHRSGLYEDDGAGAPRVLLKLVKRNRIGGVVWEDDGDGIRQDNEPVIQGVTVELYNTTNLETPVRTTETAENGTYMFKDVGNANFMVRFMYGHNDKTVKLAANGGANAKSYNGSDFIATQYQKSELLGSDALDNPGRRGAVTEYVTKDKGITNSKYKVLTSPYNDPSNTDAINTLIDETWMYADTKTITTSDTFDNKKGERTDFGIVEKPEVKLKLEKRVSAIRVTDNTGVEKIFITIAAGEAPVGKGVEFVQQIPDKTTPIKYNIELGTEILQGSNIEIEYEIKIINEGSVEATVTKIFDYIDNTSTYNTENTEWIEVSEADLDELVDPSIRGTIENNVVISNAEEITVGGNSSVTKKITLTGAFSSTDDEIGYSNRVDLMSYRSEGGRPPTTKTPGNGPGSPGDGSIPPEDDYDESEDITINSSTGEPRIYYLLGFSILIILVTGIIVIKKVLIKKADKRK